MPVFNRGPLTLSYDVMGEPAERTVVFLHGLLLSADMMAPIARSFAGRFRVVNFELHGHGKSSKPHDPATYTMAEFAQDVVALADHLGIERFGVFGTSLGADVALELMLDAPGRVAGAVLEMPVLERGARFAARVFKPVARGLRHARAPRVMGALSRRMPSWPPGFPEAAAVLAEDPVAGAAVIEGLLADAARDRWDDVARCEVPAMIIAHRLDPLHAYGDATRLSHALGEATLVRAHSVLELRLRPGRLIAQSVRFLERAFERAEGADRERATEAGS